MSAEPRQNESTLVCAAQNGDKKALQLLFERNWGWVKALVWGLVGDRHDVDDVLQETCVRVISKIDTLREPERFRAWLAVIARRQVLQYSRKRCRRPQPGDLELAVGQHDEQVDEPLTCMERDELCQQVHDAVRCLPEKYREVFVLAHSGDLKYGQIAEILDIPVTTMQIRLVRARRMIYETVTNRDKEKAHKR
ncbi:MAG: RNA polymerase sigma factor [Phycisphaerales bacterium]|nr:MAG: RNA polymerase sigma factor [Phycisphaerales bacterium]